MTALMNETVRIIDFSENETGIIRKLDNLKMRYATVINLHCLNKFKTFTNLFNQFRDLIENAKVFKILYSEIEDDVKKSASFN